MKDLHAIVDKIIAESSASDEPLAKGNDVKAIIARLRIAVCPSLLHAIASEGEMGTDPKMFAEAAECFLATVAGSLAGFLSCERKHVQGNASLMLSSAAGVVLQTPDDVHGGVVIDRVERGTSQ